MIKSCKTCDHRWGIGREFWRCQRTGYYVEIQRKRPDNRCDAGFSGWEQRETNHDQLVSNLIWFALGYGLGMTAFFLEVM